MDRGIKSTLITLGVVWILTLTQALPHPESGNVGGIELLHNNVIYLFSDHEATAAEAYLYCERYGGNLAQIDQSAEEFMRHVVGRTRDREFWFGAFRFAAESALESIASNPLSFVNCSIETDFCETNVAGPHLVAAVHDSTCISTDTCDGMTVVAQQPGGYDNWAQGEPSSSSCSVVAFRNCHLSSGCNASDWSTQSCLATKNFICQKSECPPFDTVPLDAHTEGNSEQYETYLGAKLFCDNNGTAITLNHCARQGINAVDFSLGDSGEELCEMRDQILVLPNIFSCNPSISDTNDSIDFQYNLNFRARYNYVGQIIGRHRNVDVSLVCAVRREVTLSAGAVTAERKSLQFPMRFGSGSMSVGMFLFSDSSFSEPVTDGIVQVPDPVYVGLKVFESDPDTYVVQIDECVSYDGCFCSGDVIYFISHGCPDDPATVTIIEDRNSSKSRFSFSSFLWTSNPTDEQIIYISCFVHVCDKTVPGNNCTESASCPPFRKKRDLGRGESIHEVRSELITIKPPKSCAYENGGCSHLCSDIDPGKVSCTCPDDTMTLMDDGKTCSSPTREIADEDSVEFNILEDFSSEISVFFFIASGVLCSLAAFISHEMSYHGVSQ